MPAFCVTRQSIRLRYVWVCVPTLSVCITLSRTRSRPVPGTYRVAAHVYRVRARARHTHSQPTSLPRATRYGSASHVMKVPGQLAASNCSSIVYTLDIPYSTSPTLSILAYHFLNTNIHIHTDIHLYLYIYIYVCVYVCIEKMICQY